MASELHAQFVRRMIEETQAGAMGWNTWQQQVAGVCAWSTYSSRVWKYVMEEVHGPDWKRDLTLPASAFVMSGRGSADGAALVAPRGTNRPRPRSQQMLR